MHMWIRRSKGLQRHIFHVHVDVGDSIPCFKHKFFWSWKVLDVTPFVILSKSGLLMGKIFKIICQAFELGHPHVFVSYVSQLQLQIRLTYTCKYSHIKQGWIDVEGSDGEGQCGFFLSELTESFFQTTLALW